MVGPAGSGKTALASAYARERTGTLWYRLDRTDVDPWSVFDNLRRTTRRRSLPRATHRGDIEAFAARFFASLYEHEQPQTVVFDECHSVEGFASSQWPRLLRAAIDQLPGSVRLLMTSRQEPPPLVSSLAGRGRLGLLGWPTLGFTLDETTALVGGRPIDGLGEADAEALHRWTGGWAAGLSIATARSPRSGSGMPPLEHGQPLFDFLTLEVFEELEPALREVLGRVCMLDSITPEAATALSERADAPRLLRRAARLGLVEPLARESEGSTGGNELRSEGEDGPLDSSRETYRLPPLWSAFLRARLSADETRDLTRRSASMLVGEGDGVGAAELFMALGDDETLATLCVEHAPQLMAASRGATLRRWVDALPEERIGGNAWLSYWKGIAHLSYHPTASVEQLGRALSEHAAAGDDVGVCMAWADGALAAATVAASGPAIREWEEAFTTFDLEGRRLRVPGVAAARTAIARTLLLRMTGDPRVDAWAERALAEARAAGSVDVEVMAGAIASIQFGFTGDLTRMERAMARLEQIADGNREPHVTLALAMAQTLFSYLKGSYEEACSRARTALAIGEREGVFVWRDSLQMTSIYAALGRGDVDLATSMYEELEALPAGGSVREINGHLAGALLQGATGDLVAAHRCAEAALAGMRELDADPISLALASACASHLLTELARFDEARRVGESLSALAKAHPSPTVVYWAGMAGAHLALDQGDEGALAKELSSALQVGRRTGIPHLIFPRPSVLGRLLGKAIDLDLETAHVHRVIETLRLPPPEPVPMGWPRRVLVRTLGEFAVERDGERLRLSGAPARLLQALIASGPRQTAHGPLEDALWPDAEGDSARRVLDTTLHRLRRTVGKELVRLSGGCLSIDPRYCAVDAHGVEQLCGPQRDRSPQPRSERLRALYRGPFLPAVDEPWALAYRERLAALVARTQGAEG